MELDYFPKTVILRHRKENLKKCSLSGLELRKDMQFFTYPKSFTLKLDDYVLLAIDAEPLSQKDQNKGIFLIDGTWKLAEKMSQNLPQYEGLQKRSLPSHIKTAYPRVQTACEDPMRGLASIEALFAAYLILKRDPKGLLDLYHFKNDFLNINEKFLRECDPNFK